eukprot:UN01007
MYFLDIFVKQQKTNKKKFSAFSNTKNSTQFSDAENLNPFLGQT